MFRALDGERASFQCPASCKAAVQPDGRSGSKRVLGLPWSRTILAAKDGRIGNTWSGGFRSSSASCQRQSICRLLRSPLPARWPLRPESGRRKDTRGHRAARKQTWERERPSSVLRRPASEILAHALRSSLPAAACSFCLVVCLVPVTQRALPRTAEIASVGRQRLSDKMG